MVQLCSDFSPRRRIHIHTYIYISTAANHYLQRSTWHRGQLGRTDRPERLAVLQGCALAFRVLSNDAEVVIVVGEQLVSSVWGGVGGQSGERSPGHTPDITTLDEVSGKWLAAVWLGWLPGECHTGGSEIGGLQGAFWGIWCSCVGDQDLEFKIAHSTISVKSKQTPFLKLLCFKRIWNTWSWKQLGR